MNKNEYLAIGLIILITLGLGCINNNEKTGVIIDNWNKIKEKEFQIEKVLVDNAAFRSNNLDEWTRQQQNTIGKLEILLQEENSLISDFAGSTVVAKGDANKHADNVLINIREVYKYRINALNNLKELTRAKQINDDKLYTEKENQLYEANSKIREYYTKADDDIKKLEALQNKK